MKKLIQISLILILVSVLFQAVGAGSMASASEVGSNTVDGIFLTANTSVANVQTSACLVRIKGVICASPNVGWNT
jgi:hypothetical protein